LVAGRGNRRTGKPGGKGNSSEGIKKDGKLSGKESLVGWRGIEGWGNLLGKERLIGKREIEG
jgi:hypothetical protein